jgi:hypothetical protein
MYILTSNTIQQDLRFYDLLGSGESSSYISFIIHVATAILPSSTIFGTDFWVLTEILIRMMPKILTGWLARTVKLIGGLPIEALCLIRKAEGPILRAEPHRQGRRAGVRFAKEIGVTLILLCHRCSAVERNTPDRPVARSARHDPRLRPSPKNRHVPTRNGSQTHCAYFPDWLSRGRSNRSPNARSICAPSPRQAAPCIHAKVVGRVATNRSIIAAAFLVCE